MTAEPHAEPPAELAKMIAEGLTSYNADEYVPMPELPPLSFTHDGVTLTFTLDEFGDVALVTEWADTSHAHHMRISTELGSEPLKQLYNQMIKPLLDRDAEIGKLAAAADAAHEADLEQWRAERDAHEAASAFRLQSVPSRKAQGRSYLRLHRHTCPVLNKAEHRGTKPATLDELLTDHLPAFRERYEFLLSEQQVADNFRSRARRFPLDNTVIALCGHCKPIGKDSKPVTDALDRLAHQVVHNPDNMVEVAQLLGAIENGIKETDAAYREAQS